MPQKVADRPIPKGYEGGVIRKWGAPVAAAAPKPLGERGGGEVAGGQAMGLLTGAKNFAASFSPVRFREGWDKPTYEVPEMAKSVGTLASHVGNPGEQYKDVKSMIQPALTYGQGLGALAEAYNVPGFHGVRTPTDEEFQGAAEGTGSFAAGVGVAAAPKMMAGMRGVATRAGVPQALARIGSAPDPNPTGQFSRGVRQPLSVVNPAARAVARKLYEPELPGIQRPKVYEGEFVGDEPRPDVVDVPYRPAAEPTPPPGQLSAWEQPKIGGTAPTQQALPPAAPTQQLMYGQEGGVGPKPNVDVTAQSPRTIKDPKTGKPRPETVNEMKARGTNLGRGVTKQPTADAEPFRSPAEVKLPNGEGHVPSSRELTQGYVTFRNAKGQFENFDLPGRKTAPKPTPPPKPKK